MANLQQMASKAVRAAARCGGSNGNSPCTTEFARRGADEMNAWALKPPCDRPQANLSAQSHTRDRGDGPIRRADACFQLALWLHHRSARPPRARLDRRDEQSDGRMDCTPDHRGLSLGVSTGIPHPRPRSRFWLNRKTAPSGHGHSRQTNCAPLAMAERICRTTDWVHSPRMSGSHYHLGSGASTPGAARLRELL